MMLRRLALRIVLALAVVLLCMGLYSGMDRELPSRIVDGAANAADAARKTMGLANADDLDEAWDEMVDVAPLLNDLEAGRHEFDWSDWLDLDKTKLYDRGDLDPKLYPYLRTMGFNQRPIMPYLKHASPQEQAMIARLYCKWYLPSPFRVVALDDPSGMSLRTTPARYYQVEHQKKSMRHHQFGHTNPTVYYEPGPALNPVLGEANQSLVDTMFPTVSEKLFTWDPDQVVKEAKEEEENHPLTIKKALDALDTSGKYFEEVWIRDDPVGYGVHYDWRFFRGILSHEDHTAAVHMLGRAWQQFAEQMQITYWYAHGSLLGHLWNGMAMPWDSDHDIQMPVLELDRLARDFNRTLVVQNRKEGFRKFLIDVGPYYVQRSRGNGLNVIDARFIDVDTGAYIDITGLARSNPARKLVSCKNKHLYRVHDFFRLRRSLFEGYPALIPIGEKTLLRKEYKSWNKPKFGEWQFNFQVRLWEFKQSCAKFLSKFKSTVHVYCFPQKELPAEQCDGLLGTCDQFTLDEYARTGDVTEAHSREQSKFDSIGIITPETNFEESLDIIKTLYDITSQYREPFHTSPNTEVSKAKGKTSDAAADAENNNNNNDNNE